MRISAKRGIIKQNISLTEKSIAGGYKKAILILLLLLFSLPPRLWMLTKYPPAVIDEKANAHDIVSLINKGGFHPAEFQWDKSQATLQYYPSIMIIKLFKIYDVRLALRLASVITSLILLIPVFLLIQRYTSTFTAWCATLLFSSSYYFLQFSRVGWSAIYAVTLGYFSLWAAFKTVEKRSYLWAQITGLFAGLTLYTYRGGEVLIFASFLTLFINFSSLGKSFFQRYAVCALCFTIFLIISFPWILKISNNWNLYNSRASDTSIFNVVLPYNHLSSIFDIAGYQINTSLLSWTFFLPASATSQENIRYFPQNWPFINPLITGLFLYGLFISAKYRKNIFIFLFIYILGIIFGQMLTVHPPNGARGLILLPVVYFFSALTMNHLLQRYKNKKLIKLVALTFTILVYFADILFYQYWMSWTGV